MTCVVVENMISHLASRCQLAELQRVLWALLKHIFEAQVRGSRWAEVLHHRLLQRYFGNTSGPGTPEVPSGRYRYQYFFFRCCQMAAVPSKSLRSRLVRFIRCRTMHGLGLAYLVAGCAGSVVPSWAPTPRLGWHLTGSIQMFTFFPWCR